MKNVKSIERIDQIPQDKLTNGEKEKLVFHDDETNRNIYAAEVDHRIYEREQRKRYTTVNRENAGA